MKIVISKRHGFYVDDEVCKQLIINNSPCIVRRNAEDYYEGSSHPDLNGAKQFAVDLGDGVSKIGRNHFFYEDNVCFFSYASSARSNEEFISLLNDENIRDLKIIDIPSDINFQIIGSERGELIKETIPFRTWN